MRKIILTAILIIICFTLHKPNVLANDTKVYKFNTDTKLTGVNTKHSMFFEIDKMWNIKKASLDLIISQSDIIDKDISNLTLYINGNPFYSIKLYEKMNYKDHIKVDIPMDMMKKGFNEISVASTRHISNKPCQDDYNVGNWILIHKDSSINIEFNNIVSENKLNYFPYPYVKMKQNISDLNFVLPNQNETYSKEALLIISSYVGGKYKNEDVNVKVFKNSSEVRDNDFIYIGNYLDLENNIKDLLSKDEIDNIDNNVLIKQVISPYNQNNKILLIVSKNSKLLLNAAKYLSNTDLISQSIFDKTFINSDYKLDTIKEKLSENIIFKDLGYEGIKFEGPFKHVANYVYTLPKDKKIKSTSKIHIKTSYSKNLDFEKSLVSVSINGEPIGSKKLSIDKADSDVLEVSIPEKLKKVNYYDIEVRFDLEVKDVYCDFSNKETPYAYISEQSYINIQSSDLDKVDLKNYPAPFVTNGEFNNLVFVSDNISVEFLANLSSYIGKSINYNTGSIKVRNSNNISNKDKEENLIIIDNLNSKSILEIKENLILKPNKDLTGFIGNDKISLDNNYGKTISSIQTIESPFNKNRRIIAITAPNNNLIEYTKPYLSSILKAQYIKGDVCILDNTGKLTSYSLVNEESQKNEKNFLIWIENEGKLFLAFSLMIIILLVTGAIFIVKKYKN